MAARGRVIEEKSGQTYEAFMRDILAQAGAKGMYIAGDTKVEKCSNEVVYYAGGSGDPYGPRLIRQPSLADPAPVRRSAGIFAAAAVTCQGWLRGSLGRRGRVAFVTSHLYKTPKRGGITRTRTLILQKL